jgi:transcriptional regulator with XRE-family HTH domain
MAGKKRPSSSICFLRDDERLRQAAIARLRATGWKRGQLADEVGIAPYLVSNWLNAKRPYPQQWDVIRIAKILGLKVSIEVEIDVNSFS